MKFNFKELASFFDNLGAYLFARQGDLDIIEEQIPEIIKYFHDRSSIKEKEEFLEKINKVANMIKIVHKHVNYIADKLEDDHE